MTISSTDRSILRDLAKRCMDLCESDRNKTLKQEWRQFNNMLPSRPMVHANDGLGPHRKLGADEEALYELFSLKEDPCEKHNLAEQFLERLAELTVRLDDYEREAVCPSL